MLLLIPSAVTAQSPVIVDYYHTDAIGSVGAVADQNGSVVRRHDYFPFGEENAAASSDNPIRFAGKVRDLETGLDYFGARYYASRTGRKTTVDPLMDVEAALSIRSSGTVTPAPGTIRASSSIRLALRLN